MATAPPPRLTSPPRHDRSRSPISLSRPTTPLRPSSRSSLRHSGSNNKPSNAGAYSSTDRPLDALEPQFAELSDSLADLEANFMHLQLMHESLGRFAESFASMLYGLNVNAYVVDFCEAPLPESIKRFNKLQRMRGAGDASMLSSTTKDGVGDGETTYMSIADTTILDNASLKATPRRNTRGGLGTTATGPGTLRGVGRGGTLGRGAGGGGAGRVMRGSGLPVGRGRGVGRGVK